MPQPINLIELDNGQICFAADQHVSKLALERGTIEIEGLSHFIPDIIKSLQPGDLVLDIGSFIGYYALELAKTGCDLHCFEARVDAWMCLRANLRGFYNVNIHNPMVIGDGEPCHFDEAVPDGNWGARQVKPGGTVPTFKIDNFQFTNVCFIKLDVEGYEMRALKGMTQTIKESKPLLFVEVFPALQEMHGHTAADLEHYVGSLGYDVQRLAGDPAYNILCTPK